MRDQFGREIDYMRISITDRCNLRCRYCMPQGIELVPMRDILTYEEILRVVRAATACGITKFKITGGEPLVRRGCVSLMREIHAQKGVEQVTLTTNGVLLEKNAAAIADAGIDGVNVSLDTTKPAVFREITGFDELSRVLAGIDAALRSGLRVKTNTVLQRGVNDTEWRDILLLAKDRPIDVRFIEMMPIGYGSEIEAYDNDRLKREIAAVYPGMQSDPAVHGNGPAVYCRIPGFTGSVGFISAIHGKFCGTCNRIRLTSQGQLKLCLCYEDAVDLRSILREEAVDDATASEHLQEAIREAIRKKPRAHRFGEAGGVTEHKIMTQIGG